MRAMNSRSSFSLTHLRRERRRRSVVFGLFWVLLFQTIPGAWHSAAMAMPGDSSTIFGLELKCNRDGFELVVDRQAVDGNASYSCTSCPLFQSLDSAAVGPFDTSIVVPITQKPIAELAATFRVQIVARAKARAPPLFQIV